MVTITLDCPHCQSEALVRNGHAPNGKQLYRCRACGRQSRENPTPHAYPQARREEILHAYQERSSLRGLTRTFGVSRTTVSTWIKTKELSFLPSVPPCSPRIPKIPRPRRWNWMNRWLVCAQKSQGGLGVDCPVCSSFFIATIERGPSCSSEPLPTFTVYHILLICATT